jgi:hypothetical protein
MRQAGLYVGLVTVEPLDHRPLEPAFRRERPARSGAFCIRETAHGRNSHAQSHRCVAD